MENFLFSLNATVPVFLIIFLGWFLKEKKIISKEFVPTTNDLVFKILLPIQLFMDISSTDIRSMVDVKFMVFCFVSTVICIGLIWLFAVIFIKEKRSIGSFVQGAYRGSAAILGVAFSQNMYGNSGMVPMMIIASVPFYNVMAVTLYTIYGEGERLHGKQFVKKILLGIVKNPIIIGIVCGIPFALLNVQFPTMIDKTLSNLAGITAPLALLIVGADFEGAKAIKKLNLTIVATAIKLIVQPAIMLPIAILLGFRNQELVAIVIMLSAPTTVASYIMARSMKNDEVLSCSIVVLTTLFSSVTITAIIYILKSLQYI
ncbi:MAG: AEC family transporter [Ruminococcus sp.]|nr:AEC family transporter [Ruminococcus sp.]